MNANNTQLEFCNITRSWSYQKAIKQARKVQKKKAIVWTSKTTCNNGYKLAFRGNQKL